LRKDTYRIYKNVQILSLIASQGIFFLFNDNCKMAQRYTRGLNFSKTDVLF